jgi:hypothetical protein
MNKRQIHSAMNFQRNLLKDNPKTSPGMPYYVQIINSSVILYIRIFYSSKTNLALLKLQIL